MSNTEAISTTPHTIPDATPTAAAAASIGPMYLEAGPAELSYRSAATSLRNAFRLNGEFSGMTGLIATVAAGPVADLLGIDQVWLIRGLGISLLGFSALLFFLAGQRNSEVRVMAAPISLADLGWVAGTVAIVALGWLSTVGAIVMGVVALVVLGFAIAQLRARAAMVTAGAETIRTTDASEVPNEFPPVELVAMTKRLSASVEELWPIMTDHELYAKLALNLGGAKGLTPNGPGLRRTCADSAGRTWSETCTLWDEGRRFDVNIDIDDYPYPLQLMQGSWAVEQRGPEAAAVSMKFAFQPKPGLRGRIFVPTMHVLFKPILARIARGWQREAKRA